MLEMCDFGIRKANFLAHIVGSERRIPDPHKLKTMKKLVASTNKKEIIKELKIISRYRNYITNFASMCYL